MKAIQRMISFLLVLVMLVAMVPPMAVRAEETEAIEETIAPTEKVTEPPVETTVPTETVTEPSEETTASEEEMPPTVEETAEEILFNEAMDTSVVASGKCGDNLSWVLDDEGTLTISGEGEMYDVSFGNAAWYSYRKQIYTIIIEDGVTNIGTFAFLNCNNMTKVSISKTVTTIKGNAFCGCKSLITLSIPNGVTSICASAFKECEKLLSVTISETVDVIENYAFYRCKDLDNIVIPGNVKSIGEYAFQECANLSNATISYGVTEIGKGAFYDCAKLTSITIPGSVDTVKEYTFKNCVELHQAEMQNGVSVIEGDAFSDCKGLITVSLPDGLTSIGGSAFRNCQNLKDIKIPGSVTVIEAAAFWGCSSLRSIVIPVGVSTIALDLFGYCSSLKEIVIPDTITSIGSTAFYDCNSLTEISIPESVTVIGTGAFWKCSSLMEIIIPDGVEIINENTFRDCTDLLSVTIPESVSEIGKGVFWECKSLITVKIPDKVTKICDDTFKGCSELVSVSMSKNTTSIGYRAFADCDNLSVIHIPPKVISIGEAAFSSCKKLREITIPDSVTSIGSSAFSNTGLVSITIPDSISEIADTTFSGCQSLISAKLPQYLGTIGIGAFRNCSSLDTLEIPDSVTRIGRSAFEGCKGLREVTLSKNTTSIEQNVFYGCSGLTSINIPKKVKTIRESAFEGCSNLISVRIPDSVTSVESHAFCDCTSLLSATISGRMKYIATRTFHGCTSMTSVTIPISVTRVEPYAFSKCDSISDVYYGGSSQDWNNVYFVFSAGSTGNDDLLGATIHYNIPMAVEDFYEFTAEPKGNTITLTRGEALEMVFMLRKNDEVVEDWNFPYVMAKYGGIVENPLWKKVGDNWYLTMESLAIGTDYLTIRDPLSSEKIEVKVEVDPNVITEYLDNHAISVNRAGTAYAYYQGDPNVTYCYEVNGEESSVKSNDRGIIRVPLGTFDTEGENTVYVDFLQVEEVVLETPAKFGATVTVTPLEFTQEWQISLDAGVGVALSKGVGFELGDFKAKATLGEIGEGAGVGAAMVMKRSWEGEKETLELTSDRSASANVGVESGVTGEYMTAEVDLAHVSAGAEASGVVTYGIRIKDYSEENESHKKAVAVFILGEALAHSRNNSIAKQFYEKVAERAFDQADIEAIEGTGAAATGTFDAGFLALEVDEVPVFSGLSGNINASTSISQSKYDSGDAKYSTSFSTNKNLEAVSASGLQGVLGLDYLGRDITVEVQKEAGKKSLETTSLSSELKKVSTVELGKVYTKDYNQYVFEEESLDELLSNTSNIRSYLNGGRIAVGNRDLQEIAKAISSSKTPIAYNNQEKTQLMYTLPLSFGVSLGVGVDIDTNLSYMQTVEYTAKSGYAVNDEILLTSDSSENSEQVRSDIIQLKTKIDEAVATLAEEAAKFFKIAKGSLTLGVTSPWGWISATKDVISDATVMITCPNSEAGIGWNTSDRVDVSSGGSSVNSVSGVAATIGRPFVVSVTDAATEEEIADLSEEPLAFTIRYMEEELQAAGFTAADILDGKLAMYRYSDNGDYFEFVGGVHDPEAMTVTAEIVKPGQYILAVYIENDFSEDDSDHEEGPEEEDSVLHTITIHQDYVALYKGQNAQLTAETTLTEQADNIQWSVDDENILSVNKETGIVTALAEGTAYVFASVTDGEITLTARCRVDVAQTEVVEEVEKIKLDGIRLSTQKLTTELYSTNYASFDILLLLPQNYPAEQNAMSVSQPAAMAVAGMENSGIAIEGVRFTDETMAALFELVALDDRSVLVIPTDYAVRNPKEVGGSYTGSITVTVQGKEYPSEELTLTVKKSTPKLKATVAAFNSFYSGQSQEIVITGGTPTGIYDNPDKNTEKTSAVPSWLRLDNGGLSLTEEASQKSASGKVYLLVETEEWRIPTELTLSVKNTYKAPGLKLSASSVTLGTDVSNSNGVELKLQCKSKTDTLSSLSVTDITAPDGFSVSNFNREDGSFTLKAEEGFQSEKISLTVSFSNTMETLSLPLTVKAQEISLNLSAKSVTLNTAANDSAVIHVTATPADYQVTTLQPRLTDAKGNDKTGEMEIRCENGQIRVQTTKNTTANTSYKLYVSADGSKEAVLTIKTIDKAPTVSLKAAGNIDLSVPESEAIVTAGFKNYYSGEISSFQHSITEMKGKTDLDENAAEYFKVERDGNVFRICCADESKLNTGSSYVLHLTITLPNEETLQSSVKLNVKRTAVQLKLSSSKLNLNKAVEDMGSIDVGCSVKGYDLKAVTWELMDKTGKNSMEGKLDIAYSNGKLTLAVNEETEYGATYKLLVKASASAPAATLTVTIPTKDKSNVTASLKVSGGIDVIRDGSSITVTPSYKNCAAGTEGKEELFIYSSADKYAEAVNDLFRITPNDKGGYTITKAENAKLDHSLKYQVKLVTTFAETAAESKPVSLKVNMGSANLTVMAEGSVLFAKDRNDRIDFSITTADTALNTVEKVEIKDAKYQDAFEIINYGNGNFTIGFKNGVVDSSLSGKSITLTLNIWLNGNQTDKNNAAVKLNLSILK